MEDDTCGLDGPMLYPKKLNVLHYKKKKKKKK
jgi:hypothetical protein